MKKVWFVVIGLALFVFAITGCGKKEKSGEAPATSVDTSQTVQPAAAVYYCSMHTDVVSDTAGKCTKCGMGLVEKPSEIK